MTKIHLVLVSERNLVNGRFVFLGQENKQSTRDDGSRLPTTTPAATAMANWVTIEKTSGTAGWRPPITSLRT